MSVQNNVVIIIPYFGKLPNYFQLWIESARKNCNIDILFFTDNNRINNCPENVHWIKTTFEKVKKRAQEVVKFPIVLRSPYKLVDYKPLYGAMFSDYILDYEWWGWGDIDTIWGDLSLIINKNNLERFDKILDLGHLTLMKNNISMKNLWKQKVPRSWTYKDAFTSNLIYHFDEGGGLAFIAREMNCKIYSEQAGKMNFADILPNKPDFELAYDEGDGKLPHVFTWKNGKLIGYWIKNNKLCKKEYAYIHLQKRKMEVQVKNNVNGGLIIVPNKFLSLNKVNFNLQFILSNQVNKRLLRKYISKEKILNKIINYIKYSKFTFESKKRKIPLNGNEVYFKIEKPKY